MMNGDLPAGTNLSGYLAKTPWTAGLVFVVLISWLAGAIIGGYIATRLGFHPIDTAGGLALTVVAQALAVLWAVAGISRNAGSGSLRRDVGLEVSGRDWKGLLWGLGLQVAVAILVTPLAQWLLDDSETQQQVAELAEATRDVGGRLLLIVVFVVVAPLVEEVIFRGAMLSWLVKHMSASWAVTVSAAAFAAVHLLDLNAALAVPSLFVIGLVLGWAAVRRGSLSLAIFIHAGVNLLGAILLMWGQDVTDFLERTAEDLEALVVFLPFV